MNFLKKIKDFFDKLDKILNDDPMLRKLSETAVQVQEPVRKKYPPLSAYETRREEIQASDEPIEGIFYIYDGEIILDYYSECLVDDKKNTLREQMYHFNFYRKYMQQKFSGLHYSEKSLPRGRVELFNDCYYIYIDKCFISNIDIISRLAELYRLQEDYQVSSLNYRCPACKEKESDNYD